MFYKGSNSLLFINITIPKQLDFILCHFAVYQLITKKECKWILMLNPLYLAWSSWKKLSSFEIIINCLFPPYLPAELAELPLIRLDFSCNKITTIPVCYRNLRHLQMITLDNNPLQSPPAQVNHSWLEVCYELFWQKMKFKSYKLYVFIFFFRN